MPKNLEDRVEALEDDAIETSTAVALLVQHRQLVSDKVQERVSLLEARLPVGLGERVSAIEDWQGVVEKRIAAVTGGYRTLAVLGAILVFAMGAIEFYLRVVRP